MSRGRVAKTPSPRRTFADCAGIISEKNDSGRGPRLDGRAKLEVSSSRHERFLGLRREGLLESRSGLIIADF